MTTYNFSYFEQNQTQNQGFQEGNINETQNPFSVLSLVRWTTKKYIIPKEIRVRSIKYSDRILNLKSPLYFSAFIESGKYFLEADDLYIYLEAENFDKLISDLNDELAFIFDFYTSKSDSELTSQAIELKRRLLELV